MSLPKVRVSLKGLFQTGMPFFGLIRFKLSRPAVTEDDYFIAPQEWQTVEFRPDGEAVAELIPNSVLGEGTCYEYQIIKRTAGVYISERYCKEHTVLKGVVVVPDHDCLFVDIAALPTDGKGTAESYASEAKQAAQIAVEAVKDFSQMSVEAETLPPDSEATAAFSHETNVLTLGIPQGKTGYGFGRFRIEDSCLKMDYVGVNESPACFINEKGELEVEI